MTTRPRHVLVTGAARRVGRVIALTLARAGWNVTVHYNRSTAEAASLLAEINHMGRKATLLQADLAEDSAVQTLMQSAEPFTAIVHNACLFEHDEDDPEGLHHRRVNQEAPCRLTQALFEQLPANADACAVFMLDNTSMPTFLSRYAASKETLRLLLPELALRYAPQLRINAVALGPALRHPRESEAHFDDLVTQTPLCQASTPKEVASAILFLLENRTITGQILNVDSGMHLLAN